MNAARRAEDGQAATELALVLPLLVSLLLGCVQVTLVARDQITVVAAARAAAREAAVGSDRAAVRRAALESAGGRVDPARLEVDTRSAPTTGLVTVTVTYRAATDVLLVGPLLPDVKVTAKAAMREETSFTGPAPRLAARNPAGTAS